MRASVTKDVDFTFLMRVLVTVMRVSLTHFGFHRLMRVPVT